MCRSRGFEMEDLDDAIGIVDDCNEGREWGQNMSASYCSSYQ